MAYFQMFKRDIERLNDALERLNYNPLGSLCTGRNYHAH